MMDVTKETMQQHFDAYDKFKDQICTINKEADEAIQLLEEYDDDAKANKKPYST